jgi:hypothetical protein
MHSCCHHPEDGHISGRNMSMTSTQYIYIHKTEVLLLVCKYVYVYASNLLFMLLTYCFHFHIQYFFVLTCFGITALRLKTPSLNIEREQ